MKLKDVLYVGIFIDHIYGHLDKDIPNQHVTLAFQPDEKIFNKLSKYLGKSCEISVLGYDNDGKNEGLLVDIADEIPYFGSDKKHITLSIDESSSPVKTGSLKFDKSIPEDISVQLPKVLIGTIAAFTKKRELIYEADLFNDSLADCVLNHDKVDINNKANNQNQTVNKNNDEKELCR
jgi:hypothetical protein